MLFYHMGAGNRSQLSCCLRIQHCLAVFVGCLLAASAFGASPALIPLPQVFQSNPGSFTLCPPQVVPGAPTPAPTVILVDGSSRETGEYLAMQLYKSTGYRFVIGTNSGLTPVPGAMVLTTNTALASLGTEGYELTIATNSVVIRAPGGAGLFYGVQSLLQLLPPEIYSQRPVTGVPWVAPCVYIQDWPRFPWRGWMLDTTRHFFNKDEVKILLDTMAVHKLNTFHWHLDDDSGWRLEILKYPLLTQLSGWRTDTMFGLNPRSSTAWDDTGTNYGGYYTQAEVREIVAYAAQRHITIVPEIEMPGHSSSALYAYPQYACLCAACSNQYSLNVTSYIGGAFCIARPETTNFLHDVLSEVMDLFPGQYIHIGGDEVRFTNWMNHALDQAMTNTLGISGSGLTVWQKYQSWFTQGIANWLKSKGRTMIGWSEIMNGGTITNAALMDWLTGSQSKAIQAATNGENVVMTATTTLYINKWETAADSSGTGVIWSNEPPAQSGLVLLTNVYAYEPIPAGLSAAFTNRILGAQGNSWSEWIPSLQNMQFRMYPRLCAIAEVDWTAPALKNWTDFTNRWESHKLRLAKMGVNFNPYGTPGAVGTWGSAPASYSTNNWDITSSVASAGELDFSFCWKTGSNGLDIAWVALAENGVEIDRDTHAGFTGVTPSKPLYVLRLGARRPDATYTLSASVQGRGGTNSTGVVYRPNWD
jgi:hexosaminidase